MNIKFLTLTLQCRESREVIEFSPQISYFHGQISAGKSSIMRLIDYCMGGKLERTPAISQEMVSASLSANIGNYEVLFERQAKTNQVQVSWRNREGKVASVLAPLQAASEAIWEDNVFNLSDLIFFLAGVTPIKVRKSKQDEESKLVRLSFRDIMWYCYLDQDHLDSSFFRLDDWARALKSRDAMRFITGFYTERMNELEIQLDALRNNRTGKLEAVKQIRSFLQEFGYSSEAEIRDEIIAIDERLRETQQLLGSSRRKYTGETHFADKLRNQLRELSDTLAQEEQVLADLNERISEQEALKAEILSSKFKLAKAKSASSVLSGVSFEYCPKCGSDVKNREVGDPDKCQLCGQYPSSSPSSQDEPVEPVEQAEIVQRDLTARIEELTESIEQHNQAKIKQERLVNQVRERKIHLDSQLNEELSNYDSAYLARSRELERQFATLQERKRGLERTINMLEAITKLEMEAEKLKEQENELRAEIASEKNKLIGANNRIYDIEETYIDALLSVGVPGIQEMDRVEIRRTTWMPWIIPQEGDAYNFYNAGSGGKKTLLNVCYALSVHKVAAEHNLKLPTFLMIDTPMKNIGEDVNRNIFDAFYKYLYGLASNSLSETQLIIIDKEFFEPSTGTELDVFEKYMSPDNPLISYYRGP